MLLKTNCPAKSEKTYPTMCLIIRLLFEILLKAFYCFQYDSLWKIMEIPATRVRTHDVYDRKGVRIRTKKDGHCFQQDTGNKTKQVVQNFGVEPTMCMVGKGLGDNQHFPAIPYPIENRAGSYLALKRAGSLTHDVSQVKWFRPMRPLFDSTLACSFPSLYVASKLACRQMVGIPGGSSARITATRNSGPVAKAPFRCNTKSRLFASLSNDGSSRI